MSTPSALNLFAKFIHQEKEMRVFGKIIAPGLGRKVQEDPILSSSSHKKVLRD